MLLQCVKESVELICSRTDKRPEIALILGSGLGGLAEMMEDVTVIPYAEIPHFFVSTAPGHNGRLLIGSIGGRDVLCMQGRLHYFEGYSMQQITYPIRVMKQLGIKKLLITNSCGGIDTSFVPGDLMLIEDHINLLGYNPLIGPNEEAFGVRFPDMTEVYNKDMRRSIQAAAAELGIALKHGVYCAYTGPSYETPAEIRMMRLLGANAVGMSTVPEAIVANHCGIKVAAVSCITNMAAGILDKPLTSEEVLETADLVKNKFTGLLAAALKTL